MKVKYLFVRSLEDYLENQIQPILKNPHLLKVGRQYTNIKLRPREVLGAFIICAVARFISGQSWTIARDPMGGDGVVLCMDESRWAEGAFLEQVYVSRLKEKSPATIDEIIGRIEVEIKKKHDKGKSYSEDRHLVIFLDIEGLLDYQQVKKNVDRIKDGGFDSYWLFAPWDKSYSYLVFLLKAAKDQPTAYSIEIAEDFRKWKVNRIGKLSFNHKRLGEI